MRKDRRAGLGARVWNNLQEFWAWVDERQIDVHVLSAAILYGTYRLTTWAIDFAVVNSALKTSGADIALIIAAVTAPYAAVQAAAIGFVFSARRTSFREDKPDAPT